MKISDLEELWANFESVWVLMFTDLALESLPVERPNVLELG